MTKTSNTIFTLLLIVYVIVSTVAWKRMYHVIGLWYWLGVIFGWIVAIYWFHHRGEA